MLRKNVVLFPGSKDPPLDRPHRVLQVLGDELVMFPLTPPLGKPFFLEVSEAKKWLKTDAMKVGKFPLPPYMLPDDQVPTKYQEKRDKLWAIVEPLVTGENETIIFYSGDRWRLIVDRASKVSLTAAYLLRLLQRYWQYGQMPNALLPAFANSGGKGKLKASSDKKRGRPRDIVVSGHDLTALGINVAQQDKINIAAAVKLFHLSQGQTLAESRRSMNDRFYSVAKVVDGEVLRVPRPENELIQAGAFRYWANKILSDSSLQREVLNDSFWKKRLKGRTGKAWQTTIGSGDIFEIDATVGNFYLISEFNTNHLIGRPVIYFVVDRRSSAIVGMHVGLEGPSWEAARLALYCAFTSKVDYCRKYGVEIKDEDWPAQEMCNIVVADNAELLGRNAERSLQNYLNIDSEFNPPGIPVGKGTVESKFMTVLEPVSWVPGAWKARAAEHDKRNDLDMRWDAKLTLKDITQILIQEVLSHNNTLNADHLRTKEMIQAKVPPCRRDIYLWGLENESGERIRHPDPDALYRCLLPSKPCSLTEAGLVVDGVHYLPETGDVETLLATARRKRKCMRVHYDKNCTDKVHVVDEHTGEWSIWNQTESSKARYAHMRFEEVLELEKSLGFEEYDARDQKNESHAKKQKKQTDVVNRAKKRMAIAPPIPNKREYLESMAGNRKLEKEINQAIENVKSRHQSKPEESPPRHSSPISMKSRRNNIVAMLKKTKEVQN